MSWTCPVCERELKNPNQWHNCVKVSIDSLFENKHEELPLVFDHILSELIEWPDVIVSASQNCIVFVHNKTFLIIRPMKKNLDLKFYTSAEQSEAPVIKSTAYRGKFENHIRISRLEDLNQTIFMLIKQSYLLL